MTSAPPPDPAVPPARLPGPTDGGQRRLLLGIVSVILLIAFEAMAVATAMPKAATKTSDHGTGCAECLNAVAARVATAPSEPRYG